MQLSYGDPSSKKTNFHEACPSGVLDGIAIQGLTWLFPSFSSKRNCGVAGYVRLVVRLFSTGSRGVGAMGKARSIACEDCAGGGRSASATRRRPEVKITATTTRPTEKMNADSGGIRLSFLELHYWDLTRKTLVRRLTFSLRGAEPGGEAGCWSVPLEALVGHFTG